VLGIVALLAGLTFATWPAWRVLLLGEKPTIDELLQLVCSTKKVVYKKP
jgi:hypothetical protein